MDPAAAGFFSSAAGNGRYTLAMNGGSCLSRNDSIFVSVATKLFASSRYGALPMMTRRATPCCITASRSLILCRMRWSCVIATRLLTPQYSSHCSSEPSGGNRSRCRSTFNPASTRMAGNCFPRSRSVKYTQLKRRVRTEPPLLFPQA